MRRVFTRGTQCWQNRSRALTESKVVTEKVSKLFRKEIFVNRKKVIFGVFAL